MFIARRFDFESKLQRMSVVARKSNGYYSFVKGSPEKIIDLCQPETIPEDYASILDSYTRKGYRVIAAGMKSLHKDIKDDDCFQKINDLSREYLESNLHFLGFIVMENKVKEATFNTI
jgi:cation-transporting ATPase 13A3/4/5